jgi:hypothetical protein
MARTSSNLLFLASGGCPKGARIAARIMVIAFAVRHFSWHSALKNSVPGMTFHRWRVQRAILASGGPARIANWFCRNSEWFCVDHLLA